MSIKRVDPKATFKIISQYDSALIEETPEELEALKTGKKVASGQMGADGKEIMLDESRPTRYEEYIDTLDETKLKFKEDETPTRFVIRCMLNSEMAELNEKHITIDPAKRKIEYKNRSLWFLEHFQKGCLGTVEEDGSVKPASSDDVGLGVAVAMGSVISLFTSIGKHLKKQ